MRKIPALLVLLALSLSVVKAYVLHEHRWPSATTTFNVDIPGGDGLWNRAFEQAMARWNRATIFNFRIRHTYEGPCHGLPTQNTPGDHENGVAIVNDMCGESFGESNLATTATWYRGTTKIQTNIHFNGLYSWNVYDGPARNKPVDFRRVAVHELGHALGLDHEDDVPAIMVPAQRTGNTIVAPTADDVAGVAALYRDSSPQPPPPPPPAPPNDMFSNAQTISGMSGSVTGTLAGATREDGEPHWASATVWYQWRAPANGTLTVDTFGSNFDTRLVVFTGTLVDMLQPIWGNNDAPGTKQSLVSPKVTEGTVYSIRVTGYGGEEGAIVLNWRFEQEAAPAVSHRYIFPQFAFGGTWQSTLMVLGPHNDTTCTFTAEGRYLNMGGSDQGRELKLSFSNTWSLLKTMLVPSQAASSGMAILDCDKEVLANVLFSQRVYGSLVGEALVESTEEIMPGEKLAYFFADHSGGARLALAVANPSNQPLAVRVRLFGGSTATDVINTTVNIPANAAKAFLLDELGTIPEDYVGLAQIWASRSVYAIGLKFTGRVFTTIPAVIRPY